MNGAGEEVQAGRCVVSCAVTGQTWAAAAAGRDEDPLNTPFSPLPPSSLIPQVIGVDEDVSAALRRGLPAVQLQPLELRPNSLQPELAAMGGQFDVVVFCSTSREASSGSGLAASWWREESLGEVRRVLKPGGVLAVQAAVADEAAVRQALLAAGFRLREFERTLDGSCRLVAAAE